MTSIATAKHKLARLSDPSRNLSTLDPLMCEIMIANTHSNLAVAEALEKQTKVLDAAFEQIVMVLYSGSTSPFGARHESDMSRYRLKESKEEVRFISIIKLLEAIVDALKNLVKATKK